MIDCFNNTHANLSTNYFVMFDVHTYDDNDGINYYHTGRCKRTGGCYNELVVAFFSTGGGVKGLKIYTC